MIVSEGGGNGQIGDPLILVPGPIGGDEDPVSTKEPNIHGTITVVRDGGDGGAPSILIEAAVGASTTFDKAWISLTREPRLLETSGEDIRDGFPSRPVGRGVRDGDIRGSGDGVLPCSSESKRNCNR
ncbi:MAG TPA: hypothetical protein DIU35_14635 [Candidatus Latescibacteria bacterium]|nr:hypothetical protein [Candidatus Latescibacterota bacterium]|tara:strand:- start:677 stop:1057 length:381 start_codon:yes stop_codon:yes gene_type:complete